MDLKVCEGCGGLWVRNGSEAGVYCRHCTAVLAEFPAPRAKRATGRKKAPGRALPETMELRAMMGGAR